MLVYIKNMVCIRCVMAVKTVLDNLSLSWKAVELGHAELTAPLSEEDRLQLDNGLRVYHLELMTDKKIILVEKIKLLIHELLYNSEIDLRLKVSQYLSEALHYDYTYLANRFSELEGSTIEKFYIHSRIGRVKELLVYEQITITEIAYQLHYSSVSHLCVQFRKVTGITPAAFKKQCAVPGFIWRELQQ